MQLLVAVDFSDSSQQIIEYMKEFAKFVSNKIWLVHVAEPDPEFVGYEVDPPEMRDAVARRFHKEHQQLQQLGHELRSEGLDCVALLVQGSTVETILGEIEKLSVDMVILGSHGKGISQAPSCGEYQRGRHTEIIDSCPDYPNAWAEVRMEGLRFLDHKKFSTFYHESYEFYWRFTRTKGMS